MAATPRRGIIGAGNWVADIIKEIDHWPGEGNLCNILRQETAPGGGACNVLFDLAALGTDIPLYAVGCLGDDSTGHWLHDEIRQRHIDVAGMCFTPLPTSYTDVMSGQGKRTFFHCRGASTLLDIEHITRLEVQAKVFYLGHLLILDALDAEDAVYGTRAARLLHLMQQRGCLTTIDCVSDAPQRFRHAILSLLPYLDCLTINEIEAGHTFGRQIRRPDGSLDDAALRQTLDDFFRHGLRTRVVIHYPEGATAMSAAGEFEQIASFPVERIIGANGAGDAFCAGVVYALHEELSLRQALKYGAASAAFCLRSVSAVGGAPRLEELEAKLKEVEA